MQGFTDELMATVGQRLIDAQLLQAGDYVVIMGGLPFGSRARTNFVKLHQITVPER
jgi:pyruvate kinase